MISLMFAIFRIFNEKGRIGLEGATRFSFTINRARAQANALGARRGLRMYSLGDSS
jgi:hypothetical protein